jgi:hypothetical protein
MAYHEQGEAKKMTHYEWLKTTFVGISTRDPSAVSVGSSHAVVSESIESSSDTLEKST